MKRLFISFGLAVLLLISLSGFSPAATAVTVYNPSGVRFGGKFVDEMLKESMEAQDIKRPVKANDLSTRVWRKKACPPGSFKKKTWPG